MLYHLSIYLKPIFKGLNVVHYVSFRAIASLLTALVFSFIFGNWFIEKSKSFFRSKVREWTPESHKKKGEMPTMGGVFIIGVVTATTLLWANLLEPEVWIFLLCLVGFGAVGFLDDWGKIKKNKGISARLKFVLQWSCAFAVVGLWLWTKQPATTVIVPFFKHVNPDLGFFFIFWAAFIVVGTSNAVNLTDGLDGLAIGSLIMNFATFSLICYMAGHFLLAAYLNIPFAGTAEVAVLGATLVGASLGFLWYNTYPAQIFMGDVGSLSLGSVLALMALMAKQELLLIIAGGLFVLETMSVMLQVLSYRLWKRKLFKMAPIHHHFEIIGWQESKITVRFGIISVVLCLLALVTLKLR